MMEKLEIEIGCPNCNRKFKQRVEDLRTGRSRRCLGCGATINFKGDGHRAQQAIDSLERTIKNIKF